MYKWINANRSSPPMNGWNHDLQYRPIPIYIRNIVLGFEVSDIVSVDIRADIGDNETKNYWWILILTEILDHGWNILLSPMWKVERGREETLSFQPTSASASFLLL